MTGPRCDTVRSVLILLPVLIHIKADVQQDISSVQHLPDVKFNLNEYSEYPDNEERDRGSFTQLDQAQQAKGGLYLPADSHLGGKESVTIAALDKNIAWDPQWAAQLKLTQISAVSMDPNGNIAVFHRGNRVWGPDTFDSANRFDSSNGPIAQNTVVLIDKGGSVLQEWGGNMFYLPHGLTIDQSGNYWITDVAMHQVFKFDARDIERHSAAAGQPLKPTMTLGETFIPGNDEKRFCKPTAVAVHNNGDFFVSDGYCNSRIIKFNRDGERILHWGRHWGTGEPVYSQLPPPNAFLVPHALALASALDYIYVADRENGRILCFFAGNGTFHKEYRHPAVGTKIYSVAYARERLYLVNGPDPYMQNPVAVRGFVLDIHSGRLLSMFAPSEGMDNPHDIYVTEDGAEIYVVELNNHRIYRFLQGVNDSTLRSEELATTGRRRPMILVHPDAKDADTDKSNTTKVILGLVSAAISFIIMCVAIAAIVARCQKRGRARRYDGATIEFSKLVE